MWLEAPRWAWLGAPRWAWLGGAEVGVAGGAEVGVAGGARPGLLSSGPTPSLLSWATLKELCSSLGLSFLSIHGATERLQVTHDVRMSSGAGPIGSM